MPWGMPQISDYGQKWFYKTCCLGKEVGAESNFLLTLMFAVKRKVFILIPFAQEPQNENRSSASIALLSLLYKEGKYHDMHQSQQPSRA